MSGPRLRKRTASKPQKEMKTGGVKVARQPKRAAKRAPAPKVRLDPQALRAFGTKLRAWYRRHARDLPWRRTRDPYAILVSELMLQQTQVSRVLDYWTRFLERFPTLASLASWLEASSTAVDASIAAEAKQRAERSRRALLARRKPRINESVT